ncbi:hypothetical protein H696_05870 [Fonticula alba]|uniref:Uncharacterized protein n=1 Tax=Fonticula alba TaxID=691883 RepID=A0A058Z105_FONAL|nr:hypothetical protein H696_05870 [Fonticula alba]KCV67603.1 hypothetical protein H696_05870 [Fonticula alba]|eukprot:XP_009497941.1 hypothetical protein H696_05870 [Fonticula alba]
MTGAERAWLSSTAPAPPAAPAAPAARRADAQAAADREGLCAGERLCRDIESGRVPLPQGFDDVSHFRLLLRLAGPPKSQEPIVPIGTVGRLMGLDRASTRVLLVEYGWEYGIAPGPWPSRAKSPGVGPGDPVLEDLLALAQRAPPVLGITLARLLRLPLARVNPLLKAHLPDLATDEHVCLSRLRQLMAVVPRLSIDQMAIMLSVSWRQLSLALQKHMPEHRDVLVSPRPQAQMDALREMLMVSGPTLARYQISKATGVSLPAIDMLGPGLHAEYAIRYWGPLSPNKQTQLRELLHSRCMSLREMAAELRLSVARIRWYIKYYEPAVILPGDYDRPVRHLSLPKADVSISFSDYARRFLPVGSPVRPSDRPVPEAPGCRPADRGAARAEQDLRSLVLGMDGRVVDQLLGPAGLRPPLTKAEMARSLGITNQAVARTLAGVEECRRLWQDGRVVLDLPESEVRHLRRLGGQVHPAGGRMLHTVRDIAQQLVLCPDRTYSLLHRYCPEYFFLALPPEAGSGPGGMFVPEAKLPMLLDVAIHRPYVEPLHQLAADLGCALPQVVNSLVKYHRGIGQAFKLPYYARHPCGRLFEAIQRLTPAVSGDPAKHRCGEKAKLSKEYQKYM